MANEQSFNLNPLNAGNGNPEDNPQPVSGPILPVPEAGPQSEPHPVTPVVTPPETVPVEPAPVQNPTSTETVPPITIAAPSTPIIEVSTPELSKPDDIKSASFKKYLIVAVVAVLFLTLAYIAYSYFFKNSYSKETANTSENTTEKLGADTTKTEADIEDLEKVVEDLNEIYGEKTFNEPPEKYPEKTSETSTPPSVKIVIPAEGETVPKKEADLERILR